MQGTLDYLYKRSQPNTIRRKMRCLEGKRNFNKYSKIIKTDCLYWFKLDIEGRENIPKNPCIFTANHQSWQDLITVMTAIDEYVNPVVAINAGSTFEQYSILEYFDVTATIRGQEPLAKKRQKEVIDEMVSKIKKGNKQLVFPEATYCPVFDSMLGFYKGGSIEVARKTQVSIIPVVSVYDFDKAGNVTNYYLKFLPSFNYNQYDNSFEATNELRKYMIKNKLELIKKYTPKMTQEKFNIFRSKQAELTPLDKDYKDWHLYSMNK
ncbi:MAG: 1-acyl-sn-glycerol-3-phosphate acyltransferase [Candidatus Ancillula sp.]|jgi:1-acyl-sn-glycerol-3-phosphate acyltransferase|nr:1-acyl-sn-glycerol-3-phosphate acyltransferase [Candidatus Ancillula sp.]